MRPAWFLCVWFFTPTIVLSLHRIVSVLSDKLFTEGASTASQSLGRIAQRWRGAGLRRVARHSTKERASEAKMQRSPKVTTTHRVSCDIFITEGEGKHRPAALFVHVHHLQAHRSIPAAVISSKTGSPCLQMKLGT